MNLENYYYYYQSILPPKFVDEILAYGKQHQAEMAVTGGVNEKGVKGKDGKLKKSVIKNIQQNNSR